MILAFMSAATSSFLQFGSDLGTSKLLMDSVLIFLEYPNLTKLKDYGDLWRSNDQGDYQNCGSGMQARFS